MSVKWETWYGCLQSFVRLRGGENRKGRVHSQVERAGRHDCFGKQYLKASLFPGIEHCLLAYGIFVLDVWKFKHSLNTTPNKN